MRERRKQASRAQQRNTRPFEWPQPTARNHGTTVRGLVSPSRAPAAPGEPQSAAYLRFRFFLIVNDFVAGLGSGMVEAMAVTVIVCLPVGSLLDVKGLTQS